MVTLSDVIEGIHLKLITLIVGIYVLCKPTPSIHTDKHSDGLRQDLLGTARDILRLGILVMGRLMRNQGRPLKKATP